MLIKVSLSLYYLRLLLTSPDASKQNMRIGGLVNGTLGKVVDFKTYAKGIAKYGLVLPENGQYRARGTSHEELMHDPTKWPVVQFTDGNRYLVLKTDFMATDENGHRRALRKQVCNGGFNCAY